MFDEEHETDLENEINRFLSDHNPNVQDIQFRVAAAEDTLDNGNVFCFSAMIVYEA